MSQSNAKDNFKKTCEEERRRRKKKVGTRIRRGLKASRRIKKVVEIQPAMWNLHVSSQFDCSHEGYPE